MQKRPAAHALTEVQVEQHVRNQAWQKGRLEGAQRCLVTAVPAVRIALGVPTRSASHRPLWPCLE